MRAAFCIEGLVGGWVGGLVRGWVGGWALFCESWGLLVFEGFTVLKANCFLNVREGCRKPAIRIAWGDLYISEKKKETDGNPRWIRKTHIGSQNSKNVPECKKNDDPGDPHADG